MPELSYTIDSCKEYADVIMDDVIDILDSKSIVYHVCNNKTEIIIKDSEQTQNEVIDMIECALEIPKIITSMLLDIKAGGPDIFIRLRYK